MNSELKCDFTRRLSQCNKGGMIVILYDIFFAYTQDAKDALAVKNRLEFKNSIKKASKTLDELIGALDFHYEISAQLYSIYLFCKNQLAKSLYENKKDRIIDAEGLMTSLYKSFVKVAEQDKSEPLMSNTQQVYAGMTYGKSQLNENYTNDNHRGFFA
ncbi:MAG: flagellar protein FliS [Agathobacter sp.]|nr:flagellar protein FliS [Agathobacter sp.]